MLDHSTPTEGARPRMTAGLDRNERPQQDSNLRTRLRRPSDHARLRAEFGQECVQPPGGAPGRLLVSELVNTRPAQLKVEGALVAGLEQALNDGPDRYVAVPRDGPAGQGPRAPLHVTELHM